MNDRKDLSVSFLGFHDSQFVALSAFNSAAAHQPTHTDWGSGVRTRKPHLPSRRRRYVVLDQKKTRIPEVKSKGSGAVGFRTRSVYQSLRRDFISVLVAPVPRSWPRLGDLSMGFRRTVPSSELPACRGHIPATPRVHSK